MHERLELRRGETVVKLDNIQTLASVAQQHSRIYLLIGFGAGLQYANPKQAISDVVSFIQAEGHHGSTLLIFGGDHADPVQPDVGYIAQQVKQSLIKHDQPTQVASVQSWPEVDAFVDYVFPCPRAFNDDIPPRELWGGVFKGQPVAATQCYLSAELRALLSAVICVGGGEIARQELAYALERGVARHIYIKAQARRPREGLIYGPVDSWYQTQIVRITLQEGDS